VRGEGAVGVCWPVPVWLRPEHLLVVMAVAAMGGSPRRPAFHPSGDRLGARAMPPGQSVGGAEPQRRRPPGAATLAAAGCVAREKGREGEPWGAEGSGQEKKVDQDQARAMSNLSFPKADQGQHRSICTH
jgi:hypothetical protein